MRAKHYLQADWPAPVNVRTLVSTRRHPHGYSRSAYANFNLGMHCGDDPAAVMANRQLLMAELPSAPIWLQQVHGVHVMDAGQLDLYADQAEADACFANRAGLVCTVLTADCLPVLMCDKNGTVVAAVHAGWRGLYAGIIAEAVARLPVDVDDLLVWLGPAISQHRYEVDAAFRERFVSKNKANATAFIDTASGIRADLYALARIQLQALGVLSVHGGDCCTHAQAAQFYSNRRDGDTGRQASMIWLQ